MIRVLKKKTKQKDLKSCRAVLDTIDWEMFAIKIVLLGCCSIENTHNELKHVYMHVYMLHCRTAEQQNTKM